MLSDADLAILAAPPNRYARCTAAVRAEYEHVPDHEFRQARAEVLAALADQAQLYRTPTGRRLWETAARTNLVVELALLAHPTVGEGP